MSDNVQFNIATDQDPDSGAHYQKIKIAFGDSDEFTLVDPDHPLPVSATVTIDTSTLAKEAKQDDEITQLTNLNAIDFATQTTLAAILAKIISAPSTASKQDDGNTLLSIIGGLLSGTLTVSGTVTANTGLSQPLTDTQLRATPVPVSGTVTANAGTNLNTSLLALEAGGNLAAIAGKDFATQTTLAAILAKIIAAPATEATLASILAKIIAAPATEAKQDTGNTSLATIAAKDFATQTTLALIKAKTDNIDVALSTRLKPADTLTAVGLNSDVRQGTATNLKTQSENYQGGSAVSSSNPLLVSLANTAANSTAVKVDGSAVTQPVSIAATVTTSEAAPTSIVNGKTTVTTAGTRVQLASNTSKSVTLKALSANTGTIYVGNSSVASSNGFALDAGDTVSMDISNTNVVYIDSSVNGEGVTWIAVN